MIFLFFILGALAWRLRGSALPVDDTVKRFFIWGGAVSIPVFYYTDNPFYAGASVFLAGLGASLGYWGQYTALTPPNFTNDLKLTLTACFRLLPLAVAGALLGHYWLFLGVLAGISFVPIYLACSKITITSIKYVPAWFYDGWSCFAEMLFGGVLLMSLAEGLSI